MVSLPTAYVEVPTQQIEQNVTLFGDKIFKEVIKLIWNHLMALIQYDRCSYKERKRHQGYTVRGNREKVAVCKPRREASEETNPADTLNLDSASRTMRKWISVVQATQSMIMCYGSPSRLICACVCLCAYIYIHLYIYIYKIHIIIYIA